MNRIVVRILLTVILMMVCLVSHQTELYAKQNSEVTEKLRMYPKRRDQTFQVDYIEPEERISKIQSSSKNLIAKEIQYVKTSGVEGMAYDDAEAQKEWSAHSVIGCYIKKDGTYDLTLTITGADHAQRVQKVTIYAYGEYPFQSAKYQGKKLNLDGKSSSHKVTFQNKSRGKIDITMNEGYQLEKIELVEIPTFVTKPAISKKVENHSTVKLEVKVSSNGRKGLDWVSPLLNENMRFHIYYKDKYTDKTEVYEIPMIVYMK